MAGPFGELCSKCVAYKKAGPNHGRCRLNPATIHAESWPIVNADQWCITGFRLHPDHDPQANSRQVNSGFLRTW